MRRIASRTSVLIVVTTTMFLGCSKVEAPTIPEAVSGKPTVYAVNYPLAWFAERIGGDAIDLRFPVLPGEDPAYWRPDRETLAAMQKAAAILLNGADYAKWVKTSSLPREALVNTSAAFAAHYLTLADAVEHSHGPDGMHAHEGIDFNTWLDPTLAAQQAEVACEALCGLLPAQAVLFRERLALVQADLADLDQALRECATLAEDVPLIVSHPVYGYVAKRYGWNMASLHWEPGEMPPEDQWESLETLLKIHPAKVMIWESAPDPAIAARVRGLGLAITVFNPCGNRPDEGDYLSVMRENVRSLQEGLGDA